MTDIPTGIEGVSLTVAPIDQTPGLTRRQRETAAVATILPHLITHHYNLIHTPSGAPRLVYADGLTAPYISISHSRELAAVALSTNLPIGIDIEKPQERLSRIAHKFLAPGEQGGDLDHLLKLWTAKEAVFKAASLPGLLIPSISVNPSTSTASILPTSINSTPTAAPTGGTPLTFTLKWLPHASHLIALALPTK